MAFVQHTPLKDRLLGSVSMLPEAPGCWLWMGTINLSGYGVIGVKGKHEMAHRMTYEVFIGPIPDGLELDHLCRVRSCVNPSHLEAVSRRENLRRSPICRSTIHAKQTHCLNGHPLDEVNTYHYYGHRYCRICKCIRQKAWAAKQLA